MESDAPEAPLGCFRCSQGIPGPFRMLPRHSQAVLDAPEAPWAVSDAPKAPPGRFGRS